MLDELKTNINMFFNKVYYSNKDYVEDLYFSDKIGFFVINNNCPNIIAKDKNTAFMVYVMNKLQYDAEKSFEKMDLNCNKYIYIAKYSLLMWQKYYDGILPEEIEYYYQEFINNIKKRK